jgi:hypothetical protein
MEELLMDFIWTGMAFLIVFSLYFIFRIIDFTWVKWKSYRKKKEEKLEQFIIKIIKKHENLNK